MLFLNFRHGQSTPEVETALVSRGDIRSSIFASGEVKGRKQVELKFAGGGEVAVVSVGVGDKVGAGQFLAALDQKSLKEALSQAEANLRRAQADLDYAGESRRQFLEEHKYDSPSSWLFAQFGQYDARVRAAVAAVESANSQVEAAKISLSNATLSSPISGTVVEVNIKEGQQFDASRPAIVVADLSSFVFEAEVDETDIGKVEVGQKALVKLDAYPDTEIEGEVAKIGKITTLDSAGNKVIKVELNLKGLPKDYLGLSGDVEIVREEKKNVLLLPLEALMIENGKNLVYIVKDKQVLKREVELGLESEEAVEIVKGLSEGEKVVVRGLEEVKKKNQARLRGLRFLGK